MPAKIEPVGPEAERHLLDVVRRLLQVDQWRIEPVHRWFLAHAMEMKHFGPLEESTLNFMENLYITYPAQHAS